jgi:hypothetical protein
MPAPASSEEGASSSAELAAGMGAFMLGGADDDDGRPCGEHTRLKR